MSDHHFDSLTQLCLGCDIAASAWADGFGVRRKRGQTADPRLAGCPATATLINDETAGILAVITAPDRLVISNGDGVILRLGGAAARALGTAAYNLCWSRP